MAGFFNRILWSPAKNFIRTRFSLPKSSLDPFGDFEKFFLKNHLISVPVNELDNRSLVRSQYISILIPVFQLIVILKFLIIILNEDQEFLVNIGAGMMPFNPVIGRLMYFSFFIAFAGTTSMRITFLISERFNNLKFLKDFECLKRNSINGTDQLNLPQWKISRSLAFWILTSDILSRMAMAFPTLLCSGLYSIGIFRSGNLLVSINYLAEYISFIITRDDMNRVTRCPPIDQMSMRYVQIDSLNLVRGHSDTGQFPDFPDLRPFPDSPNLPQLDKKQHFLVIFVRKFRQNLIFF